VCRDDIRTATRYHQALQPFLALSSDPDLSFEIFTLGIKLQLKQDRRMEALAAVNERIRVLKLNHSTGMHPSIPHPIFLQYSNIFRPNKPRHRTDNTNPRYITTPNPPPLQSPHLRLLLHLTNDKS